MNIGKLLGRAQCLILRIRSNFALQLCCTSDETKPKIISKSFFAFKLEVSFFSFGPLTTALLLLFSLQILF